MKKDRSSCIFYDKSFLEDLDPYFIQENSTDSSVSIVYNKSKSNSVSFNFSDIENFVSLSQAQEYDVWYPVFVQRSNTAITHKMLFRGSSGIDTPLGITKFIEFPGSFKSWDIDGSSNMCVDWQISGEPSLYINDYGLLCWYKKSKIFKTDDDLLSYEDIPIGSIVSTSDSIYYKNDTEEFEIAVDQKLVRVSQNLFEIISSSNYQPAVFDSNTGSFRFNNPNNIFDIMEFIKFKNPEYDSLTEIEQKQIRNSIKFKIQAFTQQNSILETSTINSCLYISDGDVYNYFSDNDFETLGINNSLSTYISSSLFPIYRELLHISTLDNPKLTKASLSRNEYKRLRMICKYLSTFPSIDRVTSNVIFSNKIKTYIKSFVEKSNGFDNLQKTLIDISKEFSNLSADIKSSSQLTNYIYSKKQLFHKLLSKYGAYLNIDSDTRLKYKNKLQHGPHVKIGQDITSKVNKNLNNAIVYNNMSITAGSFVIASSINENQSIFSIRDGNNITGEAVSIPLWDIEKKKLLNTELKVTAGKDIIIDFNKLVSKEGEAKYSLDDADLGDIDQDIIRGERLEILWSRIHGPDCLRFSDTNLSQIRSEGGIGGADIPKLATPDSSTMTIINNGSPLTNAATPVTNELADLRYEVSTQAKPTLFIRKLGKYVLRLRIKASFGIVYDTVNIYVVDSNGEYAAGLKPIGLNPASYVAIKPSNGLVVMCPNLRQCAIGKQGVFWPIYSDLSIFSRELDPAGEIQSFGGDLRKYTIPLNKDKNNNKIITNDAVDLFLKYEPNNTIMSIKRIILTHMRDSLNDNCANCETFYRNVLDNRGFVVDINREFTLLDIGSRDPVTGQYKEFTYSYPFEVSTQSSKLTTYGGYTTQQINNLGISIPYSEPEKILPPIIGADMDGPRLSNGSVDRVCYMHPTKQENSIIFDKGCFHPLEGWMFDKSVKNTEYANYVNSDFTLKNKTSVINMNPERRNTFKLKGPGFFNINNSSLEDVFSTQTYYSSIILSVDPIARECKKTPVAGLDFFECSLSDLQEAEQKEVNDINPHYGYRNIGGDFDKLKIINSDEFKLEFQVDPDGATPSNTYCNANSSQNYSVSYAFTRKGPYLPEEKRRKDPKGYIRFDTRISDARIEDLEVQLNFINYVNTKNLIIWLDVLPCEHIRKNIYPKYESNSDFLTTLETKKEAGDRWYYSQRKAPNSIYPNTYKETKEKINNIEDGPLKRYLKALFFMNNNPPPELTSSPNAGSPNKVTSFTGDFSFDVVVEDDNLPSSPTYRLYLLNQEHIEGNRYNFSLRFSDHANRHTSSNDSNYTNDTINPEQIKTIEKDGVVHLLPTTSAFGYSDVEASFFRRIIDTNNLHTLNNKFAKFSGMNLFIDADGKKSWGSTKFTLGIAVINESDDMEILDNVTNLDAINMIERTDKYNRSNFLINNICNWELILHIATPTFEPSDALSNINYDIPSIPGYNFIANFKDKKYLLPPVNLNAPYDYLQDAGICKYNKEKLNTPVFSYTPLDILPIINIGSAVSIYDALGQVASVDDQLAELGRQTYEYFRRERYARQSDNYFKSLYVPRYNKFPMGESDKALLSISKDNINWYQLEASIFKYSNSPILKNSKKFKYLKLNYKSAKTLSIFNFNKLSSIEQLYDSEDFKVISIPLSSPDEILNFSTDSLMLRIGQYENQKKDIVERIDNITNGSSNPELQSQLEQQLILINLMIDLYTQTVENIAFGIEKFDIIKIIKTKNPIPDQPDFNNNITGLYFIDENRKLILIENKLSLNKNLKYLRNNNLVDLIRSGGDSSSDSINNRNIVLINGLRAFYFFNSGDQITTIKPLNDYLSELRSSNKQNEAIALEKELQELKIKLENAIKNKNTSEIIRLEEEIWNKENILYTNIVLCKGYIHIGEGYKTILELQSPIEGNKISKSPEQSDVAIVYDDEYSTKDSGLSDMPFNKWSLVDVCNNKLLDDTTPETDNCMFGEGLYGTGSALVSPSVLSKKQIKNRIKSPVEQLGLKSQAMRMFNLKINNISQDNRISGYNYTYQDSEYVRAKSNNLTVSGSDELTLLDKILSKAVSQFADIYTQQSDDMALIDMHASIFNNIDAPDSGEIEINGLISDVIVPTYKFTSAECSTICNRLLLLESKESLSQKLDDYLMVCMKEKSDLDCKIQFFENIDITELFNADITWYLDLIKDLDIKDKSKKQIEANNRLTKLNNELLEIYRYSSMGGITIKKEKITNENNETIIKTVCKPYEGQKILPVNIIELKINSDNSLTFIEKKNSDDYWINIDPEQSIEKDYSNTHKILLRVEYVCELVNDAYSSNINNICPKLLANGNGESTNDIGIVNGKSITFVQDGNAAVYVVPMNKIIGEMEKYPDIEWPERSPSGGFYEQSTYEVQRHFFLNNLSKERNQLVLSKEVYLLPIGSKKEEPRLVPDGDVKNKVKDIFNLNDTNSLYIRFKRIPRKWKGMDNAFEMYKPNTFGELTKSIIPSPGGLTDNTLKFWQCVDTRDGKYVEPTLYFKWLNEMIFRAYYGSVDASEHGGRDISESKEIAEWIPYDYM